MRITSVGKTTCAVLFLTILVGPPLVSALTPQEDDASSRYYQLALEATDWITSFQVTPLTYSWGIPFHDERAWGLDPFYYANGTITAGVSGIQGGEKQRLAFLIGGHDSGLGALAALDAFIHTSNQQYLERFRVYLDYFEGSQIPGPRSATPARVVTTVAGRNITLDNEGFWAEQANVAAGPDGVFGKSDDVRLLAVFPAAEHGNAIAAALLAYYRLTSDPRALRMLDRYGNWLLKTQVRNGEFSGSYPVTQYYWALGWKPRMFETTESAWILAELHLITGNRTYLEAAVRAGEYMFSRQFTAQTWNDPKVDGALPYEWNRTRYTNLVLTNHAGFTLLAWAQLFRLTKDERFLIAAERYAKWLMSFQVTPPGTPWGDHTYANDDLTVGGFYYGYNTEKHDFEWRVALSLWSAGYAIRGLLLLGQFTNNELYLRSARIAADWLTRMSFPDRQLIPIQSLSIIKYVSSSWWGLYPQFYQPDMKQVERAEIPKFVQKGRTDLSAIRNPNPTWFERTFDVDFNVINFQMASRGEKFMKRIWSWWPDVGFEPRYGGDIAFGAFAIASFLSFKAKFEQAQSILSEIQRLTGNQTAGLPANVTEPYSKAQKLLREANRQLDDGWYSVAVAKATEAAKFAGDSLKELQVFIPLNELAKRLEQTERTILAVFGIAIVALVASNAYWHRKLARLSRELRQDSV